MPVTPVRGVRRPLLPLACATLAMLCALPAAQAAADAAPALQPAPLFPLRDFFASPPKGYFQLSDRGRWLSFMQPAAGEPGATPRRNLFVQALKDGRPEGAPRQLTRETARDISGYSWKGDGTLLYGKDFGGDENFHVVAVDAVSGKVTDLTPWPGVRAELLDDLPDDADHVLISHNHRDARVADVYRVHVRSGEQVLVASNPGNIVGWVTDHAGRLRVAVASDGVNNTLLWRAKESDDFKPLLRTDFRTVVEPQLFDFDNRGLLALSNRGRDRKALVRIDPDKPDVETVLYEHPSVDLGGVRYSRERKRLTEVDFDEDKPGRKTLDEATAAVYRTLESRLAGYTLTLQAITRDENQYIVAATSDRTPGVRYLFDRRNGALTELAVINPTLPEAQMATMTPVRYTARDGLVIPGYLTLPVGRAPKNLACVVNPHGGPWYRDGWGFNPEVQFLANRGYCVLQMNFRGSTGYGRAFWEASFGQWGLKMQDDITDGVQWLVQQGIADPKRIGIYGGSYGGYATLAGVTYTPTLYAAAVDYVGVSNLFTFMKTIPPYWEPFRQQMYAMVGNPDDPKDKARLTATSPALNAERIVAPLLIAQGAKDPRVNKAESDQVVQALKKRGVEVQYLVKDNEGHGFHNDENKFEFYGAMEAFFAQHLKP